MISSPELTILQEILTKTPWIRLRYALKRHRAFCASITDVSLMKTCIFTISRHSRTGALARFMLGNTVFLRVGTLRNTVFPRP
jgi:hypothetical protein